MRIVCLQTILMKYHAFFVIFEKATKFLICRLLQIIGGTFFTSIYRRLVRSYQPKKKSEEEYQ